MPQYSGRSFLVIKLVVWYGWPSPLEGDIGFYDSARFSGGKQRSNTLVRVFVALAFSDLYCFCNESTIRSACSRYI